MRPSDTYVEFRRVEALGGIVSADRWIAIGATRNILAQDDPTDPIACAAGAHRAWEDFADLIAATRSTIDALRREQLL